MEEREIFAEVVKFMGGQYPHRNIELHSTRTGVMVSIDGEDKFNSDSWSLLYNLQRLCHELNDELI